MEESSLIDTELIYLLDFLKMLWGGNYSKNSNGTIRFKTFN